jgi:3-phenylpropionate/trans-cinnamate dioxygenase ferredoxin subunit
MSEGIRVCGVADVPEGEAVRVEKEVAGTPDAIAVFNDDGCFFALDDTCTHEEASLADGWIEGGQVECPLHSGRFCLKTGAVLSMPATKDTRTHRVEVRDGEVWLYPGRPAQDA